MSARTEDEVGRRAALAGMVTAGGLLLARGAAASPGSARKAHGDEREEDEVSPTEDLMREHGLLNRILLVYDEAQRRIAARETLPLEPVHGAGGIVKRFVEDYHEKLEETEVFPRLEKARQLEDLTAVLRRQHEGGRRLTAEILKATTPAGLAAPMRDFVRMYRPHEAREDTVLFPAFRKVVKGRDWDRLGDAFEDREHQLFGAGGFERMVDEVAAIEKTLGIHDLAQFTPKG
jgi:hemerythrin-like domain-containing protein